jgi:hypothetical protein
MQTQTWQLFNMPVDVTVNTSAGDVAFGVRASHASQTVVLHVTGTPTDIQVDKDNWILKSFQTAVDNPTFERKLLLVNGVDWGNYGTEITSAYTDHAFTGAYPFDFWDTFPAPASGYPVGVPAPRGHGAVPSDTLGHYRNVVWVGNDFNGDLALWQDSPMLSYLHAGGNVLLMARYGDLFLSDSLLSYLGATWTDTQTQLFDCLPTRPGFSSMALLSSQTLCAAFDTVLATPQSQLLFRVSTNFSPSRGIGAIPHSAERLGRATPRRAARVHLGPAVPVEPHLAPEQHHDHPGLVLLRAGVERRGRSTPREPTARTRAAASQSVQRRDPAALHPRPHRRGASRRARRHRAAGEDAREWGPRRRAARCRVGRTRRSRLARARRALLGAARVRGRERGAKARAHAVSSPHGLDDFSAASDCASPPVYADSAIPPLGGGSCRRP